MPTYIDNIQEGSCSLLFQGRAFGLSQAHVSTRQHTSAYVSIRLHSQHTSAFLNIRQHGSEEEPLSFVIRTPHIIRLQTSAYASVRQNPSAWVRGRAFVLCHWSSTLLTVSVSVYLVPLIRVRTPHLDPHSYSIRVRLPRSPQGLTQ
jgi:hypothetical protein